MSVHKVRNYSFLLLLTVLVSVGLFPTSAHAQSTAPVIFYTDLISGPNSGGVSNNGVFVTLYGRNFGSSRGSSYVTVGGQAVASYVTWSDQKVVVQLGAKAATGSIVASVNGVQSNGVPFTVRSGNIYFVGPNGSDSNAGTSTSSPWATLNKAQNKAKAGDTIYLLNGFKQTTESSSTSAFTASKSGTSTNPIALVAYPGALATLGDYNISENGLQNYPSTSYWTVAGLVIRGNSSAVWLQSAKGWRLVANDAACPPGYGNGGCFAGTNFAWTYVYGNHIHDAGNGSSSDISNYQAVSFDTANHIDFGWNEVNNVAGCRGVLFVGNQGSSYGLSVHDNYIHNTRCSGLAFDDIDVSSGAVMAFNNLIVGTGTGPDPNGTVSDYAGIRVASVWGGSIQISNNTIYNNGARLSNTSGALYVTGSTVLTNNIVKAINGEVYVASNSNSSQITGANNLFAGAGTAPVANFATAASTNLSVDPMFVNEAQNNLQLQASSPAIDSGATVSYDNDDMLGIKRPQGKGYDRGAYEFCGNSSAGTLAFSPSTLSFGNVTNGKSSTLTGTIQNMGSSTISISSITTSGTGFSTSGISAPITLSAGQQLSYDVTFAPTAAGAVTGSLQFVSNASNSPATVSLSGTGVAATGALAASPTSLAFGSVTTGKSLAKTVTLTNTGTSSIQISGVTASGSGYSVSGITTPVTLAANQTVSFTVTLAPASTGTLNGSVTVSSNASNPSLFIPLSGTGVATTGTLSASSTAVNFGSINVGSTGTQTVTLTNTGSASVSISALTASGTGFATTTAAPITLAAGASVQVGLTFKPTAAGALSGSLTVTSNASNPTLSVGLSGTGVAVTGTLTASPTAVAFGSINVGSTGSQSVTLKNTGTASVSISAISVTGTGFASTTAAPITLAAGASTTVSLTFKPTAAGSVTGALTVASNASNATLSIALSGTGVAVAMQHSVTLSWTASTSSVSGYNVYRSTTSGSGYTKLNSSLVTGTSYTDSTVAAATTYYYVTTAVSASGVESSYSNQATVTVP